ncbi:ABC transporter [endosymbiont of Acanthamoeba sp. UWC8]|uniref:ABC transporter ATP-binding protein n=1 Tax=endosymbiont of Acanthamoeba sp. UWC8 TaxID=86106 RepID=UPI0004D1DC1D|nr:ATP-binding cassette domain-containing protein [endosymbiont of Acanthamoeba sp. UWC8]AIF80584.1 ABC transporter [endosymbiont of Acanthamoeba sp. UWC8]
MLEIKNIYKTFNVDCEPILKGINLTLNEKDFCIVIGSNGSGKSTLFKAILGDYKVDSGSIKLHNRELTNLSIYKRAKLINSITQDTNKSIVKEMTLLENLALSEMRCKASTLLPYKRKTEQLREQLTILNLGLERFLDTKMEALSGGQKQVIATVSTTFSPPSLLLLDEHTSALDPKTSAFLMDYTANLVEKNAITTLMITHNLNDAIKYGNRLIMLHRGKIVEDFNCKEKSALTITKLLDLFHTYEDNTLMGVE